VSINSIQPKEKEAEYRKKIIARTEKAKAFQDEDRIEEQANDSQKIQEGKRFVGPLEALGRKKRTQSDKCTQDQSEIAKGNACYLRYGGKS